jgi:hypothetical protein
MLKEMNTMTAEQIVGGGVGDLLLAAGKIIVGAVTGLATSATVSSVGGALLGLSGDNQKSPPLPPASTVPAYGYAHTTP